MILTESWLTDRGEDQLVINSITPTGYSMIHTPRSGGARVVVLLSYIYRK